MDLRFMFQFFFICSLLNYFARGISEVVSSMNRTLGDDVLFPLDPKIRNGTWKVEWYSTSKSLCLLIMSPRESRPSWIIPLKEYEGRLSVAHNESLVLKNVASDDSGYYEIHMISDLGEMYIQKFNLTVSGSVSTKSDMKPWIGLGAALLVVLFFASILLIRFQHPEIYKKCLNNLKKRHLQKKEHTIRTEPEEERRLEEGCELVQIRFPSDQETQTGTHG